MDAFVREPSLVQVFKSNACARQIRPSSVLACPNVAHEVAGCTIAERARPAWGQIIKSARSSMRRAISPMRKPLLIATSRNLR